MSWNNLWKWLSLSLSHFHKQLRTQSLLFAHCWTEGKDQLTRAQLLWHRWASIDILTDRGAETKRHNWMCYGMIEDNVCDNLLTHVINRFKFVWVQEGLSLVSFLSHLVHGSNPTALCNLEHLVGCFTGIRVIATVKASHRRDYTCNSHMCAVPSTWVK